LQGHGAVTRKSVDIESTDAFSTRWTSRAWDWRPNPASYPGPT